ncbi:AfsR/SARP family transcriptional regulator [Streptomyces sclerotialus]|uniref:AfsR/SARP family transcriptional regulator n=1 Tax=Streptomyces sclerotialus TaxID=1957 RepID=UPI0004CB4F44
MSELTEPDTLRFEVLGPLRVRRGGTELRLGQMQQRVVLAVLLLNANRPLDYGQLMDAVWGSDPPAHAVNLLQRHASGLRRVLEPDRPPREPSRLLAWTDAGYQLSVPAGRLDLHQFEQQVTHAHAAATAGDVPAAAEALHGALRLWQGRVCEGLVSPLLDTERQRLDERHLSVLEERIELDLTLGSNHDLIGELRQLVADHPLREKPHGLLMLALYRSGSRADALSVFRQARRMLRDELGIEPSNYLQGLHEQVLTADPALDAPQPQPAPAVEAEPEPHAAETVHAPVVPAQLPHRTVDFIGRTDVLARLNSLLPEEGADTAGAVVITAIGGAAGVGKTALANYWAHEIRDRFPDGQLYVNLRGFDPTGTPMKPAEAVRGFLDALAVPPKRLPIDTDGQAALYRSLLAGRRMLIVLENAHDAEQVRPLLPGSSSCFVVVTSRNQLTSLVATDGARPVTIDLLSSAEARDMLAHRIGRQQVAAEPEAVNDIITFTARLPLALAIVASRAAMHPQFPLAALAKELKAVEGRLDSLDGGDDVTNIRAVFSWSYEKLTAPAARLFRLLGLHPGPDIAPLPAAHLAGVPVRKVRPLLAELAGAQLITERTLGRFTLHDLLRAYAADLTRTHDAEDDRRAALRRVFDYYLHTAYKGSWLLDPHREDYLKLSARGTVTTERFADHHEALDWFVTEHPVLLAVLRQAESSGFDTHVWQLAWALMPFFDRLGHWHDAAMVQETALVAAGREVSVEGQAIAHGSLVMAHARLLRHDEARDHARQAVELFRELGDYTGQAYAYRSLALLLDRQASYRDGLIHAQRSLELFQAAGYRTGEAKALNAVGWFHAHLGDREQALTYCRRALDLQKVIGDRLGRAETWDSLGYIHHHLGHSQEGIVCYQHALDLYRELGDRYNEADTLSALGDAHSEVGDAASARAAWQRALVILEELGHPEGAQVRTKLDELGG